MSVITITSENFKQEVTNSDIPVLVDFWAEWCAPCKMLSPVVDEIAEETNKVKICKVNVDEQPALARKFKVMSIPMLIYFENGEIVGKTVGVQSKEDILKFIKL